MRANMTPNRSTDARSADTTGRRRWTGCGLLIAATSVVVLAACAGPPPISAAGSGAPLPPLQTVASVDLSRYVGTWHEIARYPFGIQDRNCARDTTADYALRASGEVSVVNRCLRADGSAFVADGVAWVVDAQTRARLQVSFLPAVLRALPIGRGDYWIIELAPDYSWVVIGEPQRRYLWVLARSPNLPRETLAGILQRLPAHGYDPTRVIASPGRAALR
jgi:apolipoprotein D and lipocalin family protein